MIDRKGVSSPRERAEAHYSTLGGTAGSQKRARLLRRAAAGSSPKALLAAAVASGILLMRVAQTVLTETAVEAETEA